MSGKKAGTREDIVDKREDELAGYIDGLYTSVEGDRPATENYVLWNVRGSFSATKWLDIWARGENLLAQRYEINAGYLMPRATVMGGINIKF